MKEYIDLYNDIEQDNHLLIEIMEDISLLEDNELLFITRNEYGTLTIYTEVKGPDTFKNLWNAAFIFDSNNKKDVKDLISFKNLLYKMAYRIKEHLCSFKEYNTII